MSIIIIIITVFLKRKTLSLETILSIHTQTHTHTGTRTHKHSDCTKLNIHSLKQIGAFLLLRRYKAKDTQLKTDGCVSFIKTLILQI